jgi:hypothetical protein
VQGCIAIVFNSGLIMYKYHNYGQDKHITVNIPQNKNMGEQADKVQQDNQSADKRAKVQVDMQASIQANRQAGRLERCGQMSGLDKTGLFIQLQFR